jgi:hypothetical protein
MGGVHHQTLLKVAWYKIAKGGRELVECLRQARLLHYAIGGVPGLDFVIWESSCR